MGYSQVTGMSSTRFPLKGLSGCGCQATSGLGQVMESGPSALMFSAGIIGLGVALLSMLPSSPQRNRRRRR